MRYTIENMDEVLKRLVEIDPNYVVPEHPIKVFESVNGFIEYSKLYLIPNYTMEVDASDMYNIKAIPSYNEDKYNVTFLESSKLGFNSTLCLIYEKMFKKLANNIKKHVKIDLLKNGVRKNFPNNTVNFFHVYVYGTIESSPLDKVEVLPYMWGNRLSNTYDAFQASGKGYVIRCPESERYAVAEIIEEKALYIHHNITSSWDYESLLILDKIINETIYYISLSEEEKQAIKEQDKIKQEIALKKSFVKELCSNIEKQKKDCVNKIVNMESFVSDYTKKIIDKIKEIDNAQILLNGLIQRLPEVAARLDEEYITLRKLKKVKNVTIASNSSENIPYVSVHVDMIYIKAPSLKTGENITYEIGEFLINIHLDGKIIFFNLTNSGNGPGATLPIGFAGNSTYNRHHPHIDGNGKACLGTYSSIIPAYIANYEFSVVVILLINFLETVNLEDHAGKGIYWWPVVKDKNNDASQEEKDVKINNEAVESANDGIEQLNNMVVERTAILIGSEDDNYI